MRQATRTPSFIALVIALVFTGCGRSGNPPTAVAPSGVAGPDAAYDGFSKELSAIKARETEPGKIEAAVQEAMARFEYPALPAIASPSAPVAVPLPEGSAKTAALSVVKTRSQNVIYHFGNTLVVTVPNGLWLEAVASRDDGSIDPILVAFYKTTGGANPAAYRVQLVGYNDDRAVGNLDSYFRWKNETGSDKSVRLVSYAYGATWGKETLSLRLMNGGFPVYQTSKTMYVTTHAGYQSDIPPDYASCAGPQGSRLQLERGLDSPTGFGSSLLAFNLNTMRGGFIRDTDYILNLEEALPTTLYGVFVGYFEGDGYQPSPFLLDKDHISATTDAMDRHYGAPFYFASLLDHFLCP